MPDNKRVLITGAAGLIGTWVREGLAGAYELSGIDLKPVPSIPSVVADMRDEEAIRPAYAGIDVVVDLANDPAGQQPWERAYGNNIPSTWNSLNAAAAAGVRRYIYTSSNRAVEGYEQDQPYSAICSGNYDGLDPSAIPLITTSMPFRPNGPYGIAKACGEAAARYFCDQFGMSVICIRPGTVAREERPRAVRQFATLLTRGDLVQLYQRAIAAPAELRWAVFFGVSNNTWRFWDIADAEAKIGYRPVDNAETWRGKVDL